MDQPLVDLFRPLADASGLGIVTLRFLVALFLNYPLAYAHTKIKSTFARHVYSLVAGVFVTFFVHGALGVLHIFLSSLVAHVAILHLNAKLASRVVFVWSFLYLSLMHVHRQWFYYLDDGADMTAGQMMLTIKLTTLAFNYADSFVEEGLLLEAWREHTLFTLPTTLQFYSYCFHYGSVLAGPPPFFVDYVQFMDLSVFEQLPNKKAPSTWGPALQNFGKFLCTVSLHLLLSAYFPTSFYYSSSFAVLPFVSRWIYTIFAGIGVRMQYYAIWALSEGANDLSGIGFNGIDSVTGKLKWDRLTMSIALNVELAQTPRDCIQNWNMQASSWFKNYIYFRFAPPHQTPPAYAMVFTNIFSAFWHGFYPGYYIYFAIAAVGIFVARVWRRRVRPVILATQSKVVKALYDAGGVLMMQGLTGFGVGSFAGLSWERGYTFMSSLYFSAIPFMLFLYAVAKICFPVPPPREIKSESVQKKSKLGPSDAVAEGEKGGLYKAKVR